MYSRQQGDGVEMPKAMEISCSQVLQMLDMELRGLMSALLRFGLALV